jgi:hypothetical protein
MHPTLRRLAPAALVLAAVFAVQAGLARRLVGNTINPVATLDEGGSRVILTGPFSCTQVEWVALRVTVTQRTTGAIAEGYAIRLGSPNLQQWQVHASARASATLEAGEATAVAVTTRDGEASDAHQWLVPVTLQE